MIEVLKNNLLSIYGKESTITYYYYLWNVVDYCGEKRVRESFKSIYNQGNEVIIGNYLPEDNTEKIAKEYGFKVINVEKDNRSMFPESKIRNKVILNSKSNFLVPLNINVEYPKNLTKYIRNWIKSNNITKRYLVLRYRFQSKDKSIKKFYGFSTVFYRRFLLAARGYDERTSYSAGSQKYGITLMKNVYKMRPIPCDLSMVHKYHNHLKQPIMHKIFPNTDYASLKRHRQEVIGVLESNFQKSFGKGVKKVKNSYW